MAQQERVFTDIDLDFTMHPITKDVSKKTKEYAVIQSLRNLILTNYYERPFNNKIGSNISKMLFEPIDGVTGSIINNEIRTLIKNFEPRVSLDEVRVDADSDNHRYNVSIRFYVANSVRPIRISLFLNRLR